MKRVSKVIIILISGFFENCLAEAVIKNILPCQMPEHSLLENNLRDIYYRAFSTIYRDLWSFDFECKYLEWLDAQFSEFRSQASEAEKMLLLTITVDASDDMGGWLLFSLNHTAQKAIIESIAIDPQYWRQGLGNKLIFALRDFYSFIKSITVFTHKANTVSPLFYESLGFKKNEQATSEDMIHKNCYEICFT